MKQFILVTTLIINSLVFSQTKQVAHKSHSGTAENFDANDYTDNFGLDESMFFQVEKVKYVKENCVIEYAVNYRKQKKIDTICDHPYFSGQYTLDQIKTFYPEDTKFEGFEGHFFNNTLVKPKEKKNNLYWIFAALVFGTGSFLIWKPKFIFVN